MTILDICQEVVATKFLSTQLAHQLDQLLWTKKLNAVERATLDFVHRGIKSGQIKVSNQPCVIPEKPYRR